MRGATRRTVLAGGLGIAALSLAGCGLGAAPTASPSASGNGLPRASPKDPSELEMTVFAPDYASPSRLDASADGIDVVSVASIALLNSGTALTPTNPRVTAMKKHADQLNKTTTLLLSNSVPGVGFSQSMVDGLLDSAVNRAAIAGALRDRVRDEGWDGIMLDFEVLGSSHAENYVSFAKRLRSEVGGSVRLDAAIAAARSEDRYRAAGFDVVGLAEHLDHLTIMAYDQHGTWSPSDPGPIGALSWQKECLEALLDVVPADQVDLGVAGYGYRWLAPDGPHSLSDRQARELVQNNPGTTVEWDHDAQEWHATLPDGQVAWWSDARSLRARTTLAAKLGINGVAVWSLAVSDPIRRPS